MKKFFKCIGMFVFGFIITFIFLFLVDSDLKLFIGTAEDASVSFSLTFKKANTQQRELASISDESSQNDNTSPVPSNIKFNTNLLLALIGLFELIFVIAILLYSYIIINRMRGGGESSDFEQSMQFQKSFTDKIGSSFESIRKTLERNFDIIEMLVQKTAKAHIEKQNDTTPSSQILMQTDKQLLQMTQEIQKLQRSITEMDGKIHRLERYLTKLSQIIEDSDVNDQKKAS